MVSMSDLEISQEEESESLNQIKKITFKTKSHNLMVKAL
jgi:hypothetical protein